MGEMDTPAYKAAVAAAIAAYTPYTNNASSANANVILGAGASPAIGNSIGTGLTPTSGASSVASGGLGGGSAPAQGGPSTYQQFLNSQTVTNGSFNPANYNMVNGVPTSPGYAPPVTQSAVQAAKPNAYYTPGDTASAQKLGAYYNLVPYTNQTLGANDVAVGGSAVIPDSAMGASVNRIAGYDAAGTAAQVTARINAMSSITPAQYQTMPTPQLTGAIQGSSQAITATMSQLQRLIGQVSQPQNANVAPILSAYMAQMDTFFTGFLDQAKAAHDNGMNDPGLLNAISIIRDEATGMRTQLDESLNARNMSQSGIYINAMNNFDKNVMSTEQTAISAHLSELTKNLQDSMTSVLNQRVAALTSFAGVASQAEIQNATNHITSLATAIQGMGQLAQTQQAGLNNLNDNATSAANNAMTNATSRFNNATDNATSRFNNATDNATSQSNNAATNATSQSNNAATNAESNIESERVLSAAMARVGVDYAQLKVQADQYQATNAIDWGKVNELIRHDKTSEATDLINANANMNQSVGEYGNATGGSMPEAYSAWVNDAAAKNGISPALLAGLIETESSWDPSNVNPKSGATGLGQFLATTAKEEGVDRTDAKSSIYGAAAYLAKRIQWAGGDLNKGIMGYGDGTTTYLDSVLNASKHYTGGGTGGGGTKGAAATAAAADRAQSAIYNMSNGLRSLTAGLDQPGGETSAQVWAKLATIKQVYFTNPSDPTQQVLWKDFEAELSKKAYAQNNPAKPWWQGGSYDWGVTTPTNAQYDPAHLYD